MSMATDEERLAAKQAIEQKAQKALHLTEPCYPVRDAARILDISLRRLYEYLRDPRLEIEPWYAEEHRRRFIWARDIRRIWVLRHSVSPKRSA